MGSFELFTIPVTQQSVFQSQRDFLQEAVAMARSFISLIGFRDQYTNSHSARVANYACAIAAELGLHDDEKDATISAAWLHDIGKIGIPDHILLKPGKLSE